jgi:ApaG protein
VSTTRRPFFHRETMGIRVTVRPTYVRDQSRPWQGQFVFAYAVRIENVGDRAAQLLARRWLIHDSAGEDTEVMGEGVVGEQPRLGPGQTHEYQSFCVLKSARGHMEGQNFFQRDDGTRFEAQIPRFALEADQPAS